MLMRWLGQPGRGCCTCRTSAERQIPAQKRVLNDEGSMTSKLSQQTRVHLLSDRQTINVIVDDLERAAAAHHHLRQQRGEISSSIDVGSPGKRGNEAHHIDEDS